MKKGYRIIDTDTHVGPNVETLELYAGPVLKERWDELRPYYQKVTEGHHLSVAPRPYKRALNETTQGPEEAVTGGTIPLRGKTRSGFKVPANPEVQNLNWEGRIEDMDKEGIDVHVLLPATFATASTALERELALEILAAYNRYLDDYCGNVPDRLKGTLLVSGVDPQWSAAEVRRYADRPWLAAVKPVLDEGLPVDDPVLNPIWEALDEADLPILHHSFFYEHPYFPGYRDIWDNLAIARMAAHPWGAARLLAYVVLSGMLDRHPRLRIGFAECSGGWIGGWLTRMQYQAEILSSSLPEIRQTPLEYAHSGRIFCGIELGEGETMAQATIDVVGETVLMYQSDYPHPQCEFPESPDVVLGWEGLGEKNMRRLMSENAEMFLRMSV